MTATKTKTKTKKAPAKPSNEKAADMEMVDPLADEMFENVDIFYGPTSTLFGSDALGGTVSMNTKKAKYLSSNTKFLMKIDHIPARSSRPFGQ